MKTVDYLFPRDLAVSPYALKKVFIVGSCMTEHFLKDFKALQPEVQFDFEWFNNMLELTPMTAEQVAGYQVQYIQLPFRTIVGDNAVRITEFEQEFDFVTYEPLAKGVLEAKLRQAMRHNREHGILTIVGNFMVPQNSLLPSLAERGGPRDFNRLVRALNDHLDYLIATEYKNAFVADVESMASSFGKRRFMDDAVAFQAHLGIFAADVDEMDNYPAWLGNQQARIELVPDANQTYALATMEFSELLLAQIEHMVRVANQTDTVKIVFFDLDNTLWRGQIAEHYETGQEWPVIHNWPVGLWEAVHHLRRRGIMVSLVSKNDEAVVRARWERAVLPWLKFEDFLLPKVNWLPKSENIRDTLAALSLTAKSAVFVDDNPVERAEVAANVPGIRVIGADPYLTRRQLLWSAETQRNYSNEETAKREESYRNIIQRDKAKAGSGSREEFLTGLDIKVQFKVMHSQHDEGFQRVSELVNKTNQFNTTGIRWSSGDFVNFFDKGGRVYAFAVQDKFSDYGTVGALLVAEGIIRQFVMSCRVLGMDVEIAALHHVADLLFAEEVQAVVGPLVETELNTPCRDVYPRAGFSESPQRGLYWLRKKAPRVRAAHVTIEA
ncbi:HAD-IIIC family phosphatase [Duganella callida]|uniref:HAD-IIIC family phosphatase n=1 Tax=Duganella callida TaxID=2561932 RepID=A0A4Y9SDH9_9BURK|nr:HAD-IIIC family phosphatase [Duganella callida]TFW18567.1 HAD-IIIC family phosphatase [Duganella callida]